MQGISNRCTGSQTLGTTGDVRYAKSRTPTGGFSTGEFFEKAFPDAGAPVCPALPIGLMSCTDNIEAPEDLSMKLFSAHIEDLRTLYITKLKEAVDMEQKIAKSLPDVIQNCTDAELNDAFRMHLDETQGHVTSVEGLLRKHIGEASTETCKVIKGLVTEVSDVIKDATDPAVRDIALIGAAQQVEHHEIAMYGTLRRWAEILGLDQDAALLESIESEEENADAVLTEIAERVNMEATV